MTELNYLDITKAGGGHIKVPSIGLTSPAITESIAKTALASFSDGAEGIPVKSLIADIEPVQTGSGDPSPSNVRPITGWTGMNVYRTGKNLLKYPYYETTHTTNTLVMTDNGDGTITANGTPSATTYFNLHTVAVPIFLKAGTYKIPATGNSNIQFNWYYSDATTISTGNIERTFTLTQDSYVYCFLRFSSGVQFSNVTIKPMLLFATETDTTYEPYGTTYPISWADEAGTVYGGTLDVTTGLLTVTDANIASYAGEALPSTWMSDRDVYAVGTTPTTGAQVVYKLATPVTYQLTPQAVLTVLGTNNIWADTGDVEVAYCADTKMYIDKVIAAL